MFVLRLQFLIRLTHLAGAREIKSLASEKWIEKSRLNTSSAVPVVRSRIVGDSPRADKLIIYERERETPTFHFGAKRLRRDVGRAAFIGFYVINKYTGQLHILISHYIEA